MKQHLGLDSERSWVILDEVNIFTWPGFDLRPIRRGESRIDYGILPPKFFDRLIEKFTELRQQDKVAAASRDESSSAGGSGLHAQLARGGRGPVDLRVNSDNIIRRHGSATGGEWGTSDEP